MKKQLVLTTLILSTLLIGCGTNSNVSKNTETVTATETAHEHNYIETVTTEPTCETDGEATYTCDSCGDTYTEVIKATGHSFTNYVSNNDASISHHQSKNFLNRTMVEEVYFFFGGLLICFVSTLRVISIRLDRVAFAYVCIL